MNKLVISIFVIILTIPARVIAQQKIDDFRGIPWGIHKDSIVIDGEKPLLIRETSLADDQYYFIQNEDYTIGTVTLENIYYVFDKKNHFFKVLLNGKAEQNEAMEYILLNRLGIPDNSVIKETEMMRYWSVGDVSVVFTEQKSKDFTVEIESDADLADWVEINSHIEDF